jgi:hypothetical protein
MKCKRKTLASGIAAQKKGVKLYRKRWKLPRVRNKRANAVVTNAKMRAN